MRNKIFRRRHLGRHHHRSVEAVAAFVIARNSSFTFKGKNVHIGEVGKSLGVRYVLEGSVRKSSAGSGSPRS